MFQGKTWDLSHFANHVSTTNQERIRRYGANDAFLVVEASHQEEAGNIGQIGSSDECDFCLAFANGFIDAVETQHKSFIDQSQAFLAFAMPSVSGFEPVGRCIVADHPSGKPLYVITPSMKARPTLSAPIPADGPELIATLFRRSAEFDKFQTAFRLLAGSVSNARDNLRAFLFAFTALDSFLSKFFKQHKAHLLQLTEADLSLKIHDYVERLRELMDTGQIGKSYPLGYRFALVASYLGFKDLDKTIAEFDHAKECRDDIAHGNDFDEAALPTVQVRNWIAELVRLYMARLDAGRLPLPEMPKTQPD